jgi:chondroitin 4-sulfotransferase 11
MKNYTFIHIPKTGGSSLSKIFKEYPHITTTEHIHGIKQKPEGFTFAISRNPYNRTLSAYNYLSTGGDQSPNDMTYKNNLFPYMSDNIIDFHFFVENMLENLSSGQVHLLPMTSFISSGTNVLIDIYFKLEELNDNWERIKNIIKVNKNLIKTNTSKKIKDKEEWLTPEIKDKIYQIYKTDFINFEYER